MDSTANKDVDQQSINRIMVARQPIYNNQMGVFGYELLFRSSAKNRAKFEPVKATSRVLASTILDFDLEAFSQHRKLVINVTRAFLDVMQDIPLPANQIILDIPDNCSIDEKLISKLKELKAEGYGVSLGGYNNLKDQRLLPIADIYRVDVRNFNIDKLDLLIKFLRRYPDLSLLALKVETMEEYRTYCDKGFDFLQGYFLSKPRVYENRDLATSELSILQLLSTVYDFETPVEELETIITHDASLSYKLIKLVNAPFFRVMRDIDSIQQAIVLLGRKEISKWASLLMLSGLKDKPVALMEVALLRSKTCELLAEKAGLQSDNYFSVGMFSALDLLMRQPIKNVLSNLPLSAEFKSAVVQHQGLLGEALSCALAFENGEWSDIGFADLDNSVLFDAYHEAINWTALVMKRL
ncbi:MAG: HDOD domain-containing protein [Gammaproteobacteria bacterium]|nr:HDOD domain-containing protein [Gammaproteobacteria bacterium]